MQYFNYWQIFSLSLLSLFSIAFAVRLVLWQMPSIYFYTLLFFKIVLICIIVVTFPNHKLWTNDQNKSRLKSPSCTQLCANIHTGCDEIGSSEAQFKVWHQKKHQHPRGDPGPVKSTPTITHAQVDFPRVVTFKSHSRPTGLGRWLTSSSTISAIFTVSFCPLSHKTVSKTALYL